MQRNFKSLKLGVEEEEDWYMGVGVHVRPYYKVTNSSVEVLVDNSKKNLTITTKVLEKSHEPEVVVSRLGPTTAHDIDLGGDKFDGDDEEDMLDILFDKGVGVNIDLLTKKTRSAKSTGPPHTGSDGLLHWFFWSFGPQLVNDLSQQWAEVL
ncbi:hypothetical protein KY284_019901 [Solanum tuberosum]|nr:hypothetical protein KY284_019901 [Solanum tuberosum]